MGRTLFRVRRFMLVGLCAASLVTGCQRSKPDQPTPASDPFLAVGHGSFLGPDGKAVTPTIDSIVGAQRYYIAKLLDLARNLDQTRALPADETRKLIESSVDDAVLAEALFIDWLIENVHPIEEAHLTSLNYALRWYYLEKLRPQATSPESRAAKGIDPDIARRLEARGVKVFLKTSAGGRAYIQECRNNGVPIPPPLFSSAWTNRGIVEGEFLSESAQAELLFHSSSSPQGVCLALPRYESTGGGSFSDEASLFGVICLGTQSNKACFWDNPRGKRFKKGVEVGIDQWVGGVDLVANGQGVCSDCHSGENPYVVHPDKPAFSGLTASILPGGWYDPLVDASWPQNPGPTNLLDAVSSTGRCDACHRVGVAGRFPEASQILPGWCGVVFETAVGGGSKRTMPPGGQDPGPFKNHIDAIRAACGSPPSTGVVVDVDVADDPGVVSPPIVVDPLYACATAVTVRGGILDATLSLSVNGAVVASRVARNPSNETFAVSALNVGDMVTAMQELNGTPSGPSPAITVRDHRVDFPGGLPPPEIDPALIYECAEIVAVRNVPGATITLTTNGGFPSVSGSSTGWTAVFGGKRPFAVNDTFVAEQKLCADNSPPSTMPRKAVGAPTSISAPTLNPAMTYVGQELVTIESLVNGSHTTVEKVGGPQLGTVTTPVSWWPDFDVATPLGHPIASGERLRAFQNLCAPGPAVETSRPLECRDLPAPRIAHPLIGANFVVVTQAVPGARIRVYDASNKEIGDGSGTVILLTRPLTGTDVLTIVQQVGKCTSKTGYRVSARNASSVNQPG